MRRNLVLFVLTLALLGGATQVAAAQEKPDDSDRVQSLVQPSIVFLLTTYSAPVRNTEPGFREVLFGGEPVEAPYRCTGFVVNPDGFVGTAAHCVLVDDEVRLGILEAAALSLYDEGGYFPADWTDQDAVDYAYDRFKLAGRVTTEWEIGYPTTSTSVSSEQAVNASVVRHRRFEQGDVALLKFDTKGVDLPGLEIVETEEVPGGTPIVAVGFPGSVDDVTDDDYSPNFTPGNITGTETRGGQQVAVYVHDAAVSEGMSGGPIVDTEGRVVGVVSFRRAGETEAFNFASPASVLNLVRGSVENEIGPVGDSYREGVEAYYNAEKNKALDRFDEVLANPGNPVLAKAAELRARALLLPDDEGFPWWGYVLIAAALVGIAVGVGLLLLRRRGAATVAAPAPAGAPAGGGSPIRGIAPAPAPPRAVPPPADGNTPALVSVGPRGETAVRHRITGEIVIGREDADILLDDEQVSRRHALLRVADGKLELSDLRSANGTEVNGRLITETVTLAHGDTIRIGTTEFRVELPSSMQAGRRSDATVIVPRPDR